MSRSDARVRRAYDPWAELQSYCRNALAHPEASRAAVAIAADRCMYAHGEGGGRAYARALNALKEAATGWRDVPAAALDAHESAIGALLASLDAYPPAARMSAAEIAAAKIKRDARRQQLAASRAAAPAVTPYYLKD